MSGGSMDYLYWKVDEYAVGRMGDAELDELMQDIVQLLHDREWCLSGDTCEDTYAKSVKQFKAKWLQGGSCRNERLKKIIDKQVDDLRAELVQMIGAEAV